MTNFSVSLPNLVLFQKATSLGEALSLDFLRFSNEAEIYTLDCNHHFASFLKNEKQNKKIHFLKIEELLKVKKDFNPKSLFLLPEINFTIFNINFDRIENKQFGAPYFVALKNKSGMSCKNKLHQLGFTHVDEPFALFPHTARFYFESQNLMSWLHQKTCHEPHNSHFEHLFFSTKEDRQVDFDCITSFYQKFRNQEPIYFEHYPMHIFYKKYFNLKIDINLNEQEIYEFNN